MIQLMYKPTDMRYMFFIGAQDELTKLEKKFNPIPQYMFLPSFRGIPKPECFLHKFRSAQGVNVYYCHSGLWKTITDYCADHGIDVNYPENFNGFKYSDMSMSYEDFRKYVDSWEITLSPYAYQLKAAWMILRYRQSLSQLATRAGKTLIAYMVFRYMLEHGAHKILMVVPNTSLVKQAVGDFDDYKEYFMSETVWAGGELVQGSNLTVGTFQSLVKRADKRSSKYDPHFFDEYDVILVDEAHTLKCESINTILNQNFMKNVKLKFGFTGSLPAEMTIDSYCCHSLMGPTIQDIRPKELMDGGFITPIEITQIRIKHPMTKLLKDMYIKCGEYLNSNVVEETVIKNGKAEKRSKLLPIEDREFTIKEVKNLPLVLQEMKDSDTYNDDEYINYLIDLCKAKGSNLLLLEQMLVHRDETRIKEIEKLLGGMEKNCIIFAHHTEYLKHLHRTFTKLFPDRKVYIITGQTREKRREEIKQELLENMGCILCASYGCVGTGLTLKNIDYGIFAQSFKSHIINLQSLGRGLCLANDKDKYRLYDIVDEFPTGMLQNQGREKMRLYRKEGFETYIKNV